MGTSWVADTAKIGEDQMSFRQQIQLKSQLGRYEARLLAHGFTQKEGIDCFDLYSPVVRYNTVRMCIFFATGNGWHPITLEVKNAFLHSTLTEKLYMEQPEGYVKGGNSHKPCGLLKAN